MRETFFIQDHAENEAGRFVPDLFLFFFKKLCLSLKQVLCSLVSLYFHSPQLGLQ